MHEEAPVIVLLGALCMFGKLGCGPIGQWAPPFSSMKKCEEVRSKFIAAIGPVEWLDGQFECVEEKDLI